MSGKVRGSCSSLGSSTCNALTVNHRVDQDVGAETEARYSYSEPDLLSDIWDLVSSLLASPEVLVEAFAKTVAP